MFILHFCSCVFRLLTLFTECQAYINGWKVYKEAWSKNWLYINRLLPKRPSLFLNSCLIIDKGIIPWCTQIEGGANYIHCFNWIIEWITNILFLLRGMHIKFLPNMQYGYKCWYAISAELLCKMLGWLRLKYYSQSWLSHKTIQFWLYWSFVSKMIK